MRELIIVPLAGVGFLISTYFTAVSYRWIRPDETWVPSFCRMGERTCASIVFTPRARVFGVPNSVLGQIFYAALIIAAPLGLFGDPRFVPLYLVASGITVLLGAYLSYSLLFVTRVPCKLCFTSHFLNLVVFLLLITMR